MSCPEAMKLSGDTQTHPREPQLPRRHLRRHQGPLIRAHETPDRDPRGPREAPREHQKPPRELQRRKNTCSVCRHMALCQAQVRCTRQVGKHHQHCFLNKKHIWHGGSKCVVSSSAKSLLRITLLLGQP